MVVPARNEADRLPDLLRDITAQTLAPAELVVVDDGSTDDTAALAAAGGAVVIRGAEPPPGWAGKPWACQQGADASTAAVLVFLDADVRLAPGALAAVVAAMGPDGGLRSVVPTHRMGRLVEHLSLMPNVVSVMGSGAALPRPSVSPTAFGPCLVTSRADYDRIGGHRRVAGSVLDDVDLGRAYRADGLPVVVLGGHGLVGYRMYPAGLRPLVEGWTKNLAGGAGRIPVARAVAVALWVAAVLTGTLALASGPTGLLAYGAVAVQLEVLSRRVADPRRGVGLTHPVLAAAFVLLFLGALVKTATGRARWRGRTVALRP